MRGRIDSQQPKRLGAVAIRKGAGPVVPQFAKWPRLTSIVCDQTRRYDGGMSLFEQTPEKSLRDQLLEARDKVRRQIEICERPTGMGWAPDYRNAIAELKAELAQIEEALASLDSTDAEALPPGLVDGRQ